MRILLLLISFIITLYLAVFYGSREISLLLLCEVLIPLTFMIIAMVSTFLLKIRPVVTKSVLTKGETSQIPVKIINKNILPCPKISGKILLENTFTGEADKQKIDFSAPPFSDGTYNINFQAKSCGIIKLNFKKFGLYDYLRFIRLPIASESDETIITVMPKLREIPMIITDNATVFFGESEKYHPEKSGDDPSEIFKIREYTDGDKIRSIHWKQSAKSDKLMVKEMSMPIGSNIAVVINSDKSLDEIFDFIAGVSYTLVINECIHTVIWFDSLKSEVKKATITDEESLYSMFFSIFSTRPAASSILEETTGYPIVLLADSNMDVYKNGEKIFNLTNNTEELVL